MSWTYSNDFTTTKDQVRFLIQDTNTSRQLVTDEEIEWLVSTEANVYTAAAMACETLVTKAGSIKSKWVGDLRIVYDASYYRNLAMSLRARGSSHQVPFAGGISISDKQTQENDSDAVQPRAFRTELDNPRTDQPAPGNDKGSSFYQVP